MRSTWMRGIHREIDSRKKERERESKENDSRNLVSVFTVARARQFSRWKEGKVKAKPPRRNSICRDRKQLSTSFVSLSLSLYPHFIPFSPAISIAITKSIYHDAHIAAQQGKSTPLLNRTSLFSRLRNPFFPHSARMRRNNSPLTLVHGKFDRYTARRMTAEFREGKCTVE